jgi:ligand-binding sensor domain-containing protein
MSGIRWILLFCSMGVRSLFAQEYSYTHYDIQEGLAGTTAYCMTQDADGLIWVGTETGVSRFDGTHFKNYTTADGLPDIEVLKMFGDTRGRVWMAPFRKSVCYAYKGRIYNPDNDTLLRKLRLKGNIEDFAEDTAGNILIAEQKGLHLVHPDGSVVNYDSIGDRPIRECAAISSGRSGHFVVQEGQQIWSFGGSRPVAIRAITIPDIEQQEISMSREWVVWRERIVRTEILSLASGRIFYRPIDTLHFRANICSIVDDSSLCFCEFNGATLFNLLSGTSKRFLPGVQVSRAFRDRDGSLWFTTLDRGLYRVNSEEFRSVALPLQTGPAAAFSLVRVKNSLFVGTEHSTTFRLSVPDYKIDLKKVFGADSKNKLFFLDTVGETIQVVSASGVGRHGLDLRPINHFDMRAKWACRKNADEIVIGTFWGCVIYNIPRNTVTDTIWRERVTALCCYDGVVYIGTFGGLYRIKPDKSVDFCGKHIPFLTKRITAIAGAPDHTIWVASADDPGIIGVRNDSVVAKITRRQGLTSDICRTLLIAGRNLWVGTDKGLNTIGLDKPGYPVTGYTAEDGLGSNMINTIYVDGPMVCVGTSTGVSLFNPNRATLSEPCGLLLTGVSNAGRELTEDSIRPILAYREPNIRFDYAGISYRSAGEIQYRYRMLGLDSVWREASQTFIDYPSLPSGSYVFQLLAINRFGVRSAVRTFPFMVATPFWKTWWFDCLLAVVLLGFAWVFVSWRIRGVRRQQEWRALQGQRMAKLEQTALQSQMNPHFIFNCLNSIQQFVFDNDMMATNEYITGFARLIRATLNYSSRSFISVAEEVEYLSDYLSLEKMRFENKMDYRISVEPDVDVRYSLLPPMMLQPYVENSVRHGLRHKTAGDGYVHIHFRKKGEIIVVTIRDNGIGRKKAKEYKTGEHIEYQSKGMSLTSARIQMIQVQHKSEINVLVQDIEDREGKPEGTQIEISFPEFKDAVREQL